MENMNFNIGNYTKFELEEVLSLINPYSENDILEKKKALYDKLTNDSNLGIELKSNIGKFLDSLSERLINDISEGIKESKPKIPQSFDQLGENKMIEDDNHMLISNPYTEGAYDAKPESGRIVGSYGAPPGIINPIKYKTIKKVVNFDTRFRDNYFGSVSTDVHITLPYKFDKVVSMNLASIEIPLTSYTISAALNNNTFVVEFLDNFSLVLPQPMVRVPVVIPDGNYEPSFSNNTDATPLEVAINNAIKGAGATAYNANTGESFPQPSGILWYSLHDLSRSPNIGLRFTIDRTSGKGIFAHDKAYLEEIKESPPWHVEPYRIYFNVNQKGFLDENTPMPMKLGWQIGFRSAVYGYAPHGPITGFEQMASIASEGVCFLRRPKYIYLAIDDFNGAHINNSFISAYADSIQNKNILARLNVSVEQQEQGIYQSGEAQGFFTKILGSRTYFGPVDIQKMRINLFDEFGRILQLNNMDWSLSLMFECLYDSNIGIKLKSNTGGLIGNIAEGIKKVKPKIPQSFDQLGENEMIESDNHMLIGDPYTKGAYDASPESGRIVGGYGAPAGIINPIKYKTIKKVVNIDTRFRDNYLNTISTDMHITLPYKFEKVVSMTLASLEIPLTSYTISAALNNNTFVVEVDFNTTPITDTLRIPITIPDGNYEPSFSNNTDATPIEVAVNNAIKGSREGVLWTKIFDEPPIIFPEQGFALRFTIDRTSGRGVFARDTIAPAEPVFPLEYPFRIYFNVNQDGTLDENTPMPMKLGWQLGFRSAVYGNVLPHQVGQPIASIASEGICFLRRPKYIYLAIDDYNNNVNNAFISAYADSIQNKSILARINLSTEQQEQGIYQSGVADGFFTKILGSRTYFGPVDIQKMRLNLFDEFGRILELNNMDWSVALMFECLYS